MLEPPDGQQAELLRKLRDTGYRPSTADDVYAYVRNYDATPAVADCHWISRDGWTAFELTLQSLKHVRWHARAVPNWPGNEHELAVHTLAALCAPCLVAVTVDGVAIAVYDGVPVARPARPPPAQTAACPRSTTTLVPGRLAARNCFWPRRASTTGKRIPLRGAAFPSVCGAAGRVLPSATMKRPLRLACAATLIALHALVLAPDTAQAEIYCNLKFDPEFDVPQGRLWSSVRLFTVGCRNRVFCWMDKLECTIDGEPYPISSAVCRANDDWTCPSPTACFKRQGIEMMTQQAVVRIHWKDGRVTEHPIPQYRGNRKVSQETSFERRFEAAKFAARLLDILDEEERAGP